MKNFDIDALQVPGTIWGGREVGTNDDAKRHLASMFPDTETLFDTPKPEQLLQRISKRFSLLAGGPRDTPSRRGAAATHCHSSRARPGDKSACTWRGSSARRAGPNRCAEAWSVQIRPERRSVKW